VGQETKTIFKDYNSCTWWPRKAFRRLLY